MVVKSTSGEVHDGKRHDEDESDSPEHLHPTGCLVAR
jgi:hypothetical protein